MAGPDAPTPILISPKEAARLLSVSPRTLWRMTFEENPGLPHIKCGRLLRYSPSDLRRWAMSQKDQKGGQP
jgi:excisionase family DNA binding protein